MFNCNCERDDWMNKSAVCIPLRYQCDGVKDCDDASDEMDCFCSHNKFQCRKKSSGKIFQCISLKWKQDGKRDCLSYEDEEETDYSL